MLAAMVVASGAGKMLQKKRGCFQMTWMGGSFMRSVETRITRAHAEGQSGGNGWGTATARMLKNREPDSP